MNPPGSLGEEVEGAGVLGVDVRGGRVVSGWGRAGHSVERATPTPPPQHITHELLCPTKLFCDGQLHL